MSVVQSLEPAVAERGGGTEDPRPRPDQGAGPAKALGARLNRALDGNRLVLSSVAGRDCYVIADQLPPEQLVNHVRQLARQCAPGRLQISHPDTGRDVR